MIRRVKSFFLSCFLVSTLFGSAVCAEELNDPLEPINRKIFWFNDTLDIYIVEPVARAYDDNLPWWTKTGISNFFVNIRYPIYLVSDVFRLDPDQAGKHTARFLINSTVGLAGFIDVAEKMGVPHQDTDFGHALGVHGIPAGPYIVIPFLGPSNARDFCGRVVDTFLNPMSYVDNMAVQGGVRVVNLVDDRSKLLETLDTGRKSSLDYYMFIQSSYGQYREGLINGKVKADQKTLDEDPFIEDPK